MNKWFGWFGAIVAFLGGLATTLYRLLRDAQRSLKHAKDKQQRERIARKTEWRMRQAADKQREEAENGKAKRDARPDDKRPSGKFGRLRNKQ